MIKLCIIGAGSIVFAKNLIGDLLSIPEFSDICIGLNDLDANRLRNAEKMAQTMIAQLGLHACVMASVNRRDILKDADFVVTTIQVGGLKAYEMDLMIPLQKYGLNQCVGDTTGVGGVFRALRTIPVFEAICRDMEELCPKAFLLNYVNPMAMVTWGINKSSSIRAVGLCHSVQNTAETLARYIGAPMEEIAFEEAGINHMGWILKFERKGEDAYPQIRLAMENKEIYDNDMVKFEVMKHFGYFVTESSHHLSEYLPYFRNYPEILEKINQMEWLRKWGGSCFEFVKDRQDDFYIKLQRQIEGIEPMEISRTHEYCSYIVAAIALGQVYKIYGNVINHSLITNLPEGCCVEVPVLVDKNGFTPCHIGAIPPQLAALNRQQIGVHELTVMAALTGDKEAAMQAVQLDPLTAATLPLPKIRQMCSDLFEAEAEWLPQMK